MRNIAIIIMIALACAAQATAVDYKGTYKGSRIQPTIGVATTATAPTVGFQSTSAYSNSFEEQSQPMLNADGTVNAEAYGVGQSNAPGRHIRTATPNPDVDPNDPGNVPLGDGLIALMLCACAYLIVRATRKEKKIG